jgi:hypothetical protein
MAGSAGARRTAGSRRGTRGELRRRPGALAAARALTLFCGLGQADQAEAVLREARATVEDDRAAPS